MFGVGLSELIVILIIALIFVGPGKLPEVGKAMGQAVRNFKKASEGGPDENEHAAASEKAAPVKEEPATPTAATAAEEEKKKPS